MDSKGRTIAELSKKVGFVFQNPDHMIFADTVEDEISFGPRNLEGDPRELDRRIDEVLSFTRLDQYKETHPMSLSGGEKQRLALASIIISEPEILILDEPTTGLDYNSVNSMIKLIKELNDKGKTIILITHDMGLVSQVAKRVVLMKDGQIIRDGGIRDIFLDEEGLAKTFLEQPYALKLSLAWGRGGNITPEDLVKDVLEGGR
jgi:energy-coupling factor transport system ATP-binding protein